MSEVLQILSLKVSNQALQSKELPKRLKVLGWGNNTSIKGPVNVTDTTSAVMPERQKKLGFDRIALDFNHNSLKGSDNYQPDPRKVAAYGTPTIVPNDGIYLENIDWTPAGEEFARNYHDLSPSVAMDKAGDVTFLHSVALCGQGCVDGLTFYSVPDPTTSTSPQSMDYKVILLTSLGLPATATDDEIQSKIKALAANPGAKDPAKPAEGADKSGNTTSLAVAPEFVALSARVETVLKTLEAQTEENHANKRKQLLEEAAREGKVLPLSADILKIVPLAVLAELVEKTASTVPLDRRTPTVTPFGVSLPTGIEGEVMKNLGITTDQWKAAA